MWYPIIMTSGKPYNPNIDLMYHSLRGKKILDKTTEKLYNIERVVKQYYNYGWYITLVLERNGSHDQVTWENISVKEDWIIEEIQENQEIYEIITK